ncbi:MAG: SLC13 family permease [Thaumarchaeota archaeon]|nr:SLC13 family permease [Nitrososphaerota archaeon]MCL5319033.1 SLC13 family permease [Nitrososphaerota archaeon]
MSNKIHRTIAGIIGAALTALFVFPADKSLSLTFGYISWETLGLLFGMFTLVLALTESGFFRWLGLWTLEKTHYNSRYIFLAFPLLAAILSMYLDSITVMLFMASLTMEVAATLKFNPTAMLIAEIAAANIGGSATMAGDPPNIIIGTYFGYSFVTFMENTGVIALLVLPVVLGFFYLTSGRKLPVKTKEEQLSQNMMFDRRLVERDPWVFKVDRKDVIKDQWLFKVSLFDLGLAVVLLTLHSYLQISIAVVGILVALVLLVLGGNPASKTPRFLEKMDWSTIVFFGTLFVVVGGMEYTGVIEMLAHSITSIGGGSHLTLVSLILWLSAGASAIIDNVPFAATMTPLIKVVSQTAQVTQNPLTWSLALGTDMGGIATPIGASANVVGLSVAEKHQHRISWSQYCKLAIPATILAVGFSHLLLILRYLL